MSPGIKRNPVGTKKPSESTEAAQSIWLSLNRYILSLPPRRCQSYPRDVICSVKRTLTCKVGQIRTHTHNVKNRETLSPKMAGWGAHKEPHEILTFHLQICIGAHKQWKWLREQVNIRVEWGAFVWCDGPKSTFFIILRLACLNGK